MHGPLLLRECGQGMLALAVTGPCCWLVRAGIAPDSSTLCILAQSTPYVQARSNQEHAARYVLCARRDQILQSAKEHGAIQVTVV